MRNLFVKSSAVVMLFATMATPAFAKDHGNRGDNGNGNRGRGSMMKEFRQEAREEKREIKKEEKEDRKEVRKSEDKAKSEALSACLKEAAKTHVIGMTTARVAFLTAKLEALKTQGVFTANLTAFNAWRDAKAKADAAFKMAKQACHAATPAPTADAVAPSGITTLALSGATSGAVTLTWTATGDDAAVGTAAQYDIRYSTAAITSDALFAAATQVSGEPAPLAAGTSQTMTVSGLTSGTTYHFAIKAKDEVGNVSVLSNVPSIATLADVTAPSAITNLSVVSVTTSTVGLSWTATGDDAALGTASQYDIRYSTTAITTDAQFSAATAVSGEPAPLVAGTSQSMTVSGLTGSTAYFFAAKANDEAANVSVLSNVPTVTTLAP